MSGIALWAARLIGARQSRRISPAHDITPSTNRINVQWIGIISMIVTGCSMRTIGALHDDLLEIYQAARFDSPFNSLRRPPPKAVPLNPCLSMKTYRPSRPCHKWAHRKRPTHKQSNSFRRKLAIRSPPRQSRCNPAHVTFHSTRLLLHWRFTSPRLVPARTWRQRAQF